MANSLNIPLKGKIVLIKVGIMRDENKDEIKRAFLIDGGFGASETTRGSAIFGTFLCDNERTRLDGYDIERLAPQHIIDYYTKLKQTLNNLNVNE